MHRSGCVTISYAGFEDGTSSTAHVLVGADGIRSATRATMYARLSEKAEDVVQAVALEAFREATWTGSYVYRAPIRSEDLIRAAPDHRADDRELTFSITPQLHSILRERGRIAPHLPFLRTVLWISSGSLLVPSRDSIVHLWICIYTPISTS